VRFRSHVRAARAACGRSGGGKAARVPREEFAARSEHDGSKANDARITQTVIAMKGDLEKFRSSWRTWSTRVSRLSAHRAGKTTIAKAVRDPVFG